MNYTDGYLRDLVRIQDVIPNISLLKEKSILITGAGGLIGSAIVDFLIELNDLQKYKINIYIAGRNYEKIKNRFEERMDRSDIHYIEYDACLPIHFEKKVDYLIHGASNANPAAYDSQPVETMLANFIGIQNLLEYVHICGVDRILYISSSEIYGKKENNLSYKEEDYNFLDILNPRACYPSSKRAAETLCAAYQKEYNINAVIVRPGHVYGPTMTPQDTRAASQFAKNIVDGKNITMKSAGTQLRSYCYVLDCVSAIITVLLNGKRGEAYNISNPESIVTIKDLAKCFAEVGNRNIEFEIPTVTETASYNLMNNSSLNSTKLQDLGWYGLFNMEDGVRATLAELMPTNIVTESGE